MGTSTGDSPSAAAAAATSSGISTLLEADDPEPLPLKSDRMRRKEEGLTVVSLVRLSARNGRWFRRRRRALAAIEVRR